MNTTLRHALPLILFLPLCLCMGAQTLTLEKCVELATANYPVISKYRLVDRTGELNLSDINKSWLPQIGVYGQGTVQNVVPSFPDALSEMMDRLGADIPGLGKLQYKVGVDLNQTIWDGGASKAGREVERTLTDERRANLDVQLYAVRERVENLFFGILLMDKQIEQTQLTGELLRSNLGRLQAMMRNGTAMQSDVDMVEAQYLATRQSLAQARATAGSYRRMLGIFIGEDPGEMALETPAAAIPADLTVNRPELGLYDARMRVNDARDNSIRASLMPKVGLFAQAYYGYPGLDYFKSMMNKDLSFNAIAGVKVSWNIGSLYTRKNNENRLRADTEGIGVERETFLFNSRIKEREQYSRIEELREVMADDDRIVELRAGVRKAAEAQLVNGVIDTTALLTRITDENLARLAASYHKIQYIQSIYQLKYTLNR